MIGGKKKGDPRVRAILEAEDINYEITSDGNYKVVFSFNDNRSQVAFVNSDTETFADVEIREVWSPGLIGTGQLSATVANELLERNSNYKIGGWQIVKKDGRVVASFKAVLSADANRLELANVLGAVAIEADEVEKEFLRKDYL